MTTPPSPPPPFLPNDTRPRRSCLYMPGSNDRAMQKAQTIKADVIIFDLEDAVAPDAKIAARQSVCAALRSIDFGHREKVVRINALESIWGGDDLAAIVAAGADAILVPKVTKAADIMAIDTAIDSALDQAITASSGSDSNSPDIAIWVMIEMPLAILNIAQIAASAGQCRLRAFVMGTNDLGKEMRALTTSDRAAFRGALEACVTAARAFGLIALDGVFNDISDEDGLAAECLQGRIMGYEGKTLIHPAQLATANRIFAPDTAEIAHANAVIAAFADPANHGKGVLKVDGKMTELLHLEQAQAILSMAQAIAQAGD